MEAAQQLGKLADFQREVAMKKQILGSLVMFGCVLTHAQASDLRLFGSGGVAFGGATLASETYTPTNGSAGAKSGNHLGFGVVVYY